MPGIATVDGFGLVTAVSEGSTTVSASSGTAQATAEITVLPAGPGVPIDVVIELDWPEGTTDLDAYMTGPVDLTGGRFLLWWAETGSLDALPFAWLGRDSSNGSAPPGEPSEFIQLTRQLEGVYRFYVNDPPGGTAGIPITVRILKDGIVEREFASITSDGPEQQWIVFELAGVWTLGTNITTIDTHQVCDTVKFTDGVPSLNTDCFP